MPLPVLQTSSIFLAELGIALKLHIHTAPELLFSEKPTRSDRLHSTSKTSFDDLVSGYCRQGLGLSWLKVWSFSDWLRWTEAVGEIIHSQTFVDEISEVYGGTKGKSEIRGYMLESQNEWLKIKRRFSELTDFAAAICRNGLLWDPPPTGGLEELPLFRNRKDATMVKSVLWCLAQTGISERDFSNWRLANRLLNRPAPTSVKASFNALLAQSLARTTSQNPVETTISQVFGKCRAAVVTILEGEGIASTNTSVENYTGLCLTLLTDDDQLVWISAHDLSARLERWIFGNLPRPKHQS